MSIVININTIHSEGKASDTLKDCSQRKMV